MTETSTPPATDSDSGPTPESPVRDLIGRITRLEIAVGALIALVMASLVLIEPNILEAPFENERTVLFTFGGTALAAVALVAMLRLRVPPAVRLIVLVVPFAIVNWWLISPYFTDEVVDEGFSTSISAQLAAAEEAPVAPSTTVVAGVEDESTTDSAPPVTTTPPATEPAQDDQAAPPAESIPEDDSVQEEPAQEDQAAQPAEPPAEEEPTEEQPAPVEEETPPPTAPSGPVLLGAGQFVGLAGHSGTGDAGIFQNPDGSLVIRFENFNIENGPDLEVYLVPGADQTSLPQGSIHLGELKGNIGDQTYQLPPGTELPPGAYTVLVWCEAFSVEFVGATISI